MAILTTGVLLAILNFITQSPELIPKIDSLPEFETLWNANMDLVVAMSNDTNIVEILEPTYLEKLKEATLHLDICTYFKTLNLNNWKMLKEVSSFLNDSRLTPFVVMQEMLTIPTVETIVKNYTEYELVLLAAKALVDNITVNLSFQDLTPESKKSLLEITRLYKFPKLGQFRGWCEVPYVPEMPEGQQNKSLNMDRNYMDSDNISVSKYFKEEFDIDLEFEQYARIEVPEFSHGRKGRFIHDFSVNKTGIIDLEGHRCFIMPLNRTLVRPPHSLYDHVIQMRAGHYDVDTEIVRDTMRVVTPPITDFESVGDYIAKECASLPTYNLEKVDKSVYKRSLGTQMKTCFVEFAGNKISEIKIVNLAAAVGAPPHKH